MTYQHTTNLHTCTSAIGDKLTILVNLLRRLEQVRELNDFMKASMRIAGQGSIRGVAGIEETARPA